MQIVINIPEEDWEFIKESNGCRWSRAIIEGVINGVPLPEHHGRLIDADAVKNIAWYSYTRGDAAATIAIVNSTPTVIKADISGKEQE